MNFSSVKRGSALCIKSSTSKSVNFILPRIVNTRRRLEILILNPTDSAALPARINFLQSLFMFHITSTSS